MILRYVMYWLAETLRQSEVGFALSQSKSDYGFHQLFSRGLHPPSPAITSAIAIKQQQNERI